MRGTGPVSPWATAENPPERPTPSGERFPPRSRLDQALTVAQKRIQAGQTSATSRPPPEAGDVESEWGSAHRHVVGEPPTPPEDSPHVVVDLRPETEQNPGPVPAVRQTDYGLGRRWGTEWKKSAQGWITGADGRAAWRPVVTTTVELANWDVDTYLGVVTAEVAVEAPGGDLRQLGATLAKGREMGIEGLVDEAVERGAHAVIGVGMQYTTLGPRMLITLTGTAVTLRDKQI